ncbi:MAG: hypothetical protein GVY08_09335 [Bacteroidetes bacterium]|nr:hypothetical protein [Bacteroidota bacterium]
MKRQPRTDRIPSRLRQPWRSLQRAVRRWFNRFENNYILPKLSDDMLYRYYAVQARLLSTRSDANPLKIVWVDPDQITYYNRNAPLDFGCVAGGDWDLGVEAFEDDILFRSLEKRFRKGAGWPETDLYRAYASRIDEPSQKMIRRGIHSIETLENYFKSIEKLYHNLAKNGFKTQKQLVEDEILTSDPSRDNPNPILNEITVNIFRDGSFGKRRSGNHRLSIAKLLPSITTVPVLVRVRHTEWQKIRDQVRSASKLEDLNPEIMRHLDHPDLRDIVPGEWLSGR